jgi:pimeloyl-ACP methyl ester carboxylesterase
MKENNYIQPDISPAGVTLSTNSGLFVYTVQTNASTYYAVTTVIEGNENRIISAANTHTTAVAEQIAVPIAYYLEKSKYPYDNELNGYVFWLGPSHPLDPSDAYGMNNRHSMPFRFSFIKPYNYDPNRRYPLYCHLHSWSHDYFDSQEQYANAKFANGNHGAFCLGFNDRAEMIFKNSAGNFSSSWQNDADNYGYTFYRGWNSGMFTRKFIKGTKIAKGFRITQPFPECKSVMYTEKAMMFVITWLQQHSQWATHLDSARVYCEGGSMGGWGSLALAIHYPDRIAAIAANVGPVSSTAIRADFRNRNSGCFGPEASNIPMPSGEGIYDYLDLGKQLIKKRGKAFPYIRATNGKNDTLILWDAIPQFYNTIASIRSGYSGYWDQGGHNTGDPDPAEDFPEYQICDPAEGFVNDIGTEGFNPFYFSTDQSYIAFFDCSMNQNPGNGDPATGDAYGGINRFAWFDRNTISETEETYEVDLFLLANSPTNSATMSVSPCRLQSLIHKPNTAYNWQLINKTNNSVLQSGSTVADADGIISIPNITLSKTHVTLKITLTIPATVISIGTHPVSRSLRLVSFNLRKNLYT